MSDKSSIEWTDSTFNPWIGCTKVSPGCDHCYAAAWDRRFAVSGHAMRWGAGKLRTLTSAANWKLPLRWNAQHWAECPSCGWRGHYGTPSDPCCGVCGTKALPARRRVFCASLGDVFDNEVDPQWRADLLALINDTPNLDWLLLTKRIGNAARMIADACAAIQDGRGAWPWPNVWLGATVVNQEEADRDIPKLLDTPARVRFLSIEPMLGPVDLREWFNWHNTIAGTNTITNRRSLNWVIAGGESGPHARPSHPDWFRSLRDQCAAAGVPFLFKQWGEWVSADCLNSDVQTKIWRGRTHFEMRDAGITRLFPTPKPPGPPHFGCNHWLRVGKKAAGRVLDGVQHDGFPS